MNKYHNACTEVLTILKYLNIEDYNKIPADLLQALEENQNKEYKFQFDWNIDYKSQSLMQETKAILFMLFNDYLATEEQRKIISQMQTKEKKIKEFPKKQLAYKLNLFEKNKTEINVMEETSLTIPQKDSFFKHFLIKIKQILKRIL